MQDKFRAFIRIEMENARFVMIYPDDRMVMMDTHLMTPSGGILRIAVLLERKGVTIGI
jgi:hypothetical protein